MTARQTSTCRATVLALILAAMGSQLGACRDTRQSDFYAIRNLHLRAKPGEGTVTVRAEPVDLLARERRALALSALNEQD